MRKSNVIAMIIVTLLCVFCYNHQYYDKTSSQHNGIYVRIGHNQIYSVGLTNQYESLGMCNANGTALKSNEWICLQDNNLENGLFTLFAHGKNDELICKKTFHYLGDEKRIEITIDENGQFLETIYKKG